MSDNRKPAVGYIRMSTDQQQDSPARQHQDIQAVADRRGYRIVRWYEDHGQTGTESSKRREFQKLLADAKAGTFAAVLVSEQSRMSREDIFDVMMHWKLLRDAGVAIVTCQRGELQFDNLGGFLTAIVDQYGAREESIRLADRVVSGKRLAIRQGQRQGGALFGYDREILDEVGRVVRRVTGTEKFRKPLDWSSRLVPALDSKAVETVRYIFEAIGDGISYGSVARVLNRRGCTTLGGKRFNGTVVRRIVTNPAYAGDLVLGRQRRGRFRSLHDEGGITHENVHDPLVSRQVFARAQEAVQRRYRTPKATTPGRYLLTSLVYLAGSERRLHGYTMRSEGRPPRRYYGLAPRFYEEYPQESDRPSFRAEVVENAVLAKLRDYLADKRNQRAIQAEINRRTRKAQANVETLEKQLGAVRTKIERGTENLALANPEDVPGISRLLAGWRDEEAKLKEKLQQAKGEGGPTPESLAIMARIDQLLDHLSEADREKLAFAIRQTVKRITLRRTRLGDGRYRVTLWDGAIELRDDLGPKGMIPLTDDDFSGLGRWRDTARFVREHGGVVYLGEVAETLGINKAFASRLLAQATLAGKIRNLGHQLGWTAASPRS